jgi:hypothetical protein
MDSISEELWRNRPLDFEIPFGGSDEQRRKEIENEEDHFFDADNCFIGIILWNLRRSSL